MPVVGPKIFRGVVIVAAPHMDDEVLACGATIAALSEKSPVHCVYATDGSRSPAPALPWLGTAVPDLAATRMREAKAAMAVLGVPEANLRFLGYPDGRLSAHENDLSRDLLAIFRALRPSCVLAPFRYDRHPDHLSLSRAAVQALQAGPAGTVLYEYFVYYRWALLPGNDLRRFVRPERLLTIESGQYAGRKRQALQCYATQTTLVARWQDRPIIPEERILEVSGSPECFVRYDPQCPGAAIFARAGRWIRLAHRLEPALKRQKERVGALLRLKAKLKAENGNLKRKIATLDTRRESIGEEQRR